jgi:hypothetical protein
MYSKVLGLGCHFNDTPEWVFIFKLVPGSTYNVQLQVVRYDLESGLFFSLDLRGKRSEEKTSSGLHPIKRTTETQVGDDAVTLLRYITVRSNTFFSDVHMQVVKELSQPRRMHVNRRTELVGWRSTFQIRAHVRDRLWMKLRRRQDTSLLEAGLLHRYARGGNGHGAQDLEQFPLARVQIRVQEPRVSRDERV